MRQTTAFLCVVLLRNIKDHFCCRGCETLRGVAAALCQGAAGLGLDPFVSCHRLPAAASSALPHAFKKVWAAPLTEGCSVVDCTLLPAAGSVHQAPPNSFPPLNETLIITAVTPRLRLCVF